MELLDVAGALRPDVLPKQDIALPPKPKVVFFLILSIYNVICLSTRFGSQNILFMNRFNTILVNISVYFRIVLFTLFYFRLIFPLLCRKLYLCSPNILETKK